jgi:hypothetical protein
MEDEFIKREEEAHIVEPIYAINDEQEGTLGIVRRTTFDESRNVEH